ncbi:MAG TPA: hypothetical protein VJ867_08120 [Gemmatimonadaceae bacterium]|nr:hypothetical protein [Gemmatimonadaceae bacterium]
MTTNRREFLEHLGTAAMLGALPLTTTPGLRALAESAPAPAEGFDFSWTNKLKGKPHKAVFDNAEVDSAYGVWRAGMWEGQYQESFGLKPADTQTVLVLRHNAIVLAFQQPFWDANAIGESSKATHPLTQQGIARNPALLSSAADQGFPAQFDAFALNNFIARGGIVLACNVALGFFAMGLAQKLNISQDEARSRALAAFLPGVTLQPSGVFACVRAQEAGCAYVRAS